MVCFPPSPADRTNTFAGGSAGSYFEFKPRLFSTSVKPRRAWAQHARCTNPHPGGDDVELLTHHLAEALELHCVMRTGALGFRQRMLDVDARQELGQ